eukprot:TRINITY_DN1489_c0_g1_i3.p1 TRINITY_DN1489_c0_g1~~TRINITY_DN1489_c0_g1_i3.p1  ORF type:complete len:582 (+),score=102.59 TRINITY_DN1489_c0_g1_i3:23-1768(+)
MRACSFACVSLPDDTILDKTRKKYMLLLASVGMIATIVSYPAYEHMIAKVSSIITFCMSLTGVCYILCTKTAPPKLIFFLLVAYTIRLLSIDFVSKLQRGLGTASLVVVIIDIALICRLKKAPAVVLVLTVMEQLMLALEFGFDIGISDMVDIPEEDRRLDCDCVDPPCASLNTALLEFMVMSCVFLMDYYFTRSFANSVVSENAKIESAIRTTHSIAKHIVAFEIDEAQVILEAAEGLPLELATTLGRILINLNQYKPYLPQSCFQAENMIAEGNDLVLEAVSDTSHPSNSDMSGATSESATEKMVPAIALKVDLTKCIASLLVANIQSSLSVLHSNLQEYASMHNAATEAAMSAFGKNRGVLELFIGDRFHASFNAIKQNYSHAKSAVIGAATFRSLMKEVEGELSVNVAISTGSLVKGDLGSQVLRRFTEVGRPVIEVHVMERYGNMFNHSLLCSRKTCDESGLPNMMLLSDTIWCCGEESLLFELQQSGQAQLLRSESEVKDGEWMYHIGNDDNCTDEKRNKEMFLYLKQSLLPYPQRDLDALNSCETFKPDLISELKKSDSRQRSPLIFSFTAKDS